MVGRTGKAVLSPNEYEDALVIDDPLSAESRRPIFAIAISLCFSLSCTRAMSLVKRLFSSCRLPALAEVEGKAAPVGRESPTGE